MLIPSIDLLGGKIVQLVQGSRKALEFDDPDEWIARFSSFQLVQLIDLDAAMGTGNNCALLRKIINRLPCQVGGGIRSIATAQRLLEAGAQRIIIGSRLILGGEIDHAFAEQLAATVSSRCIVCALDSRQGKVSVGGWRTQTPLTALAIRWTARQLSGSVLFLTAQKEG